ncbi:MAG: helix-hairpin-helix domain-containing protein, partial [Bacteroidales bacterium]|nr:helix-hairpin-helix domain-containing protein [Bacteroidales bacterium]
RRGLALTTNGAGDELYVVVAHDDGIAGGDAELWVFDANGANLASGIDREVAITGSDNSAASALCLADDRLLVLFHAGGRLRLWQAGLAAPMDPLNGLDHGADLYGLSAGSDGQFVYSATVAGASIQRFDVSAADFAPATIDGAVDATLDKVSRVAVAVSSAADQLVVLDADNNSLRLVDPAGGADVIGAVALAHPPQAVAVGNGAHWAWVLVNDGFNSLVQSVNLHSLRQGHPVTAGTPVAVGDASRGMVISTGGERLFIPYVGDLALDNAGGVALLDIADANCRDLLWPDDCPSCETSDCLVLATIDNYRPGFRVLDMPTPAPDPLADLGAGIARIDNRLGRQPLPSTQAIAAALACLMENGCGASGGAEQGPPGLPGTPGADGAPGQDGAAGQDGEDGRSISQVDVEMIPCGNPPSGSVSEVGDDLLLSLRIPGNCNPDLAHLCNINWFHDGHYGGESITSLLVVENDQRYLRLLIRFDAPVRARDLNRHSIAVALSEYHSAAYQRMDLHVEIIPGVFSSPPCELKEFIRDERIDDDYADGAEILVPAPWLETMKSGFVLRVSVHGDFIRDQKGRGADLDHLPPWLSNQDPGEATAARTGDHVAGGQFISWLSYTREGKPVDVDRFTIPGLAAFDEPFLASFGAARRGIEPAPGRVAVNRASREELMTLRGVGPELAQAIVHARAATPLRSEADLLRIPGIGDSLLTRLRARISFDNGD